MGSGEEVRQVMLYSRLACAQKVLKVQIRPKILSMIVVLQVPAILLV